jgi:hypothetical protein
MADTDSTNNPKSSGASNLLDQIDKRDASITKAMALITAINGERFEGFTYLSKDNQQNFMWALGDTIREAKEANDAVNEAEFKKRTIDTPALSTLSDAAQRKRITLEAVWEIDQLTNTLLARDDEDNLDLVPRGIAIRIKALSSAIMSAQDDSQKELDDAYLTVFGKRLPKAA